MGKTDHFWHENKGGYLCWVGSCGAIAVNWGSSPPQSIYTGFRDAWIIKTENFYPPPKFLQNGGRGSMILFTPSLTSLHYIRHQGERGSIWRGVSRSNWIQKDRRLQSLQLKPFPSIQYTTVIWLHKAGDQATVHWIIDFLCSSW